MMRKLIIPALALGLFLGAVSAANADPITDLLSWIFGTGGDPTQGDPLGGAQPLTGGGDGSGTTNQS